MSIFAQHWSTVQRAGLAALCVLLLLSGCTRTRYRLQADRQVQCLVTEKSNSPLWAMPSFNIEMDPRSRYFDPWDRDHEPQPPDDPAAHQFMEVVDGMPAFRHWGDNGYLVQIDNPRWKRLMGQYATFTAEGKCRVDLAGCIQLGMIHSSDYQSQKEEIYLSALDVSTERFRFVTQFYGGFGPNFTHLGKLRSANGTEQNTLTASTNPTPTASAVGNPPNLGKTPANLQFQKQFAAGGQLLVGFANSFVWQFAGPNTNATTSLLNFNLVQPLLRGAGRAVNLETLTISERTLLNNLRAMQRYRQGFYTNIAVGDFNGVTPPQREGGFTGGTGLTGFSGQGTGGFGEVGQATNFGRAGFAPPVALTGGGGGATGFAGGGAGNIGGFAGLLQQTQQIRNTEDALGLQLRALAVLEANLEAGLIDIVQVDQFRQNIETERANLLQAKVTLINNIETFQRTLLYLPPDLPLELDDTLIQKFRLADPDTRATENDILDVIAEVGKAPREPSVDLLTTSLDKLDKLRSKVADCFKRAEADLKALDDVDVARRKLIAAEDLDRFMGDRKKLDESLADLEKRFDKSDEELKIVREGLTPESRAKSADALVGLASSLANLTGELLLVQIRARLEAIVIEPIEMKPNEALNIALGARLDWANNRASLVDTWRLIQYNANALRSNLTVTFSGDLGTVGPNPVAFRGTNGDLSTGLRFDPPFTRLLERNNYRQILINYQQNRRTMIAFGDSVNQVLRQDLRTLTQLKTNLEIQRRAVAIAVRRVDKTREDLSQPPAVTAPGQPAAQLGPTASLNLLNAISDLRNAQNNFMSVWITYYSERMQFYRDLGVMEIDDCGLWIDQPLDKYRSIATEEIEPLPPCVPDEWLRDADIDPRQLQTPAEMVPAPSPGPELKPVPGGQDLPSPPQPRRPTEETTPPRTTDRPSDDRLRAENRNKRQLAPSASSPPPIRFVKRPTLASDE
jgi:hypothetical protein